MHKKTNEKECCNNIIKIGYHPCIGDTKFSMDDHFCLVKTSFLAIIPLGNRRAISLTHLSHYGCPPQPTSQQPLWVAPPAHPNPTLHFPLMPPLQMPFPWPPASKCTYGNDYSMRLGRSSCWLPTLRTIILSFLRRREPDCGVKVLTILNFEYFRLQTFGNNFRWLHSGKNFSNMFIVVCFQHNNVKS